MYTSDQNKQIKKKNKTAIRIICKGVKTPCKNKSPPVDIKIITIAKNTIY